MAKSLRYPAVISIRLTEDQRAKLEEAAEQAGVSPSEWARLKLLHPVGQHGSDKMERRSQAA